MALVNTMEGLIDDKLRMMLEGETCCKCERCFEDMKAIALNSLPSKYVNTHNGELFSKLDAGIIQNLYNLCRGSAVFISIKSHILRP